MPRYLAALLILIKEDVGHKRYYLNGLQTGFGAGVRHRPSLEAEAVL